MIIHKNLPSALAFVTKLIRVLVPVWDLVFTWNYRTDAYLRSKAPLAIYMFIYVAMKCIPDTLFGVKVNNSK